MQNMERCQFDQGQSISVEYMYTLKCCHFGALCLVRPFTIAMI